MVTPYSLQDCQNHCEHCHRICLQTMLYALRQSERRFHESHLRLLLDCAALCETCAGFLLRGSDYSAGICRACASLCERCAEFCGERREDVQMRLCEQACLRCSESCAQLAA